MPRKTIQLLLAAASHKIERLDAEVLLARLLDARREDLVAHGHDQPSRLTAYRFWRLVKKRKNGVPVAYITKEKEFFGLNFFVNKNVLIPRGETELLVSLALERIIENQNADTIYADIGTGSGCIPISVMASVPEHLNIESFAIDISRSALRVARKNARRYHTSITFLHGNLLEPLIRDAEGLRGTHLVLTANLPYLTRGEYAEEPSIRHEPKQALVADDTSGLSLYETLIRQLQDLQKHKPQTIHAFFEINPDQADRLTTSLRAHFPKSAIRVIPDLSGRNRVAAFTI